MMYKIFTTSTHPTTNGLFPQVSPEFSWTIVKKADVAKLEPEQLEEYDLLVLQEQEHYWRLKDIPKPKILMEHTIPFPYFNSNAPIHFAFNDPLIKAVVFITEEQPLRWRVPAVGWHIIPLGMDVDAFPEWKGGTKRCLTVCNNLPERNWCCGTEVWDSVTRGVPTTLVGYGNDKYIGRPNTNITGEVSYDEIKKMYASYNVFFNHTLYSTLPTTLYEAMAVGIPIVTTAGFTALHFLGKQRAVVTNILPELRKGIERYLEITPTEHCFDAFTNRNIIKERLNPEIFRNRWKELIEWSLCPSLSPATKQ